MKTPALAIGWTIWRRHRWGLGAVGAATALVIGAAAAARAMLDPGEALQACAMIVMPFAIGAPLYLAAVFSFGFDTDVASSGTSFPARMFTLPVRTGALAGWPLIYGAAILGLLWLVIAGLIFRPAGMDVPLGWPVLLVAAQLAWIQALVWWPFGLPWARIIVGMLLFHLPATGTMLALKLDAPEPFLVAFVAAVLVAGAWAAQVAVARSRRGAIPQWERLSFTARAGTQSTRRRSPFHSAGHALRWFEWRRHGLALPVIVTVMVPLSLLALFLDEQTPGILFRTLALTVLIPVFFAGMAASTVGKNNAWVREYYGVSSFAATRPVSTVAMVVAKLQSAAVCTLVTWAVVAVATAAALIFSGAYRVLGAMFDDWLAVQSPAEVAGTLIALAALLVLVTWKRIVENLAIGLTGREWVIKGSVIAGLLIAVGIVCLTLWLVIHPEYHATVRSLTPWMMAVAIVLKLLAAAWAIRELRRRRLLTDRALLVLTGIWFAVVGSLAGLLVWVVPASAMAWPTLVMVVVLSTPLARLSAMPLAMDWNRHR
jgi:hypothetical protein